MSDLAALGLIERMARAPEETPAAWPANELDEIRLCLGPGMAPEQAPGYNRTDCARIRATPRGRFVLNAVVAKLSESFQSVASPAAMDIAIRGL